MQPFDVICCQLTFAWSYGHPITFFLIMYLWSCRVACASRVVKCICQCFITDNNVQLLLSVFNTSKFLYICCWFWAYHVSTKNRNWDNGVLSYTVLYCCFVVPQYNMFYCGCSKMIKNYLNRMLAILYFYSVIQNKQLSEVMRLTLTQTNKQCQTYTIKSV